MYGAGTVAPFEFGVAIIDITGDPTPIKCAFDLAYAPPDVYKVFVPFNCLGSPTTTRARFEMTYDQPPLGGTTGTDKAPNFGWWPVIDTEV